MTGHHGPVGPATVPGAFRQRTTSTRTAAPSRVAALQGYPGYSPASAEMSERRRNSFAAYGDMEVRPSDRSMIGGALRFEHYDDAGASLTGKLATRIGLGGPDAALRAAVSTGFRAPRLAQRGFNTLGFVGGSDGLVTAGFLPEGDPIACEDFGACSLDHETSLSLTGGLVYLERRRPGPDGGRLRGHGVERHRSDPVAHPGPRSPGQRPVPRAPRGRRGLLDQCNRHAKPRASTSSPTGGCGEGAGARPICGRATTGTGRRSPTIGNPNFMGGHADAAGRRGRSRTGGWGPAPTCDSRRAWGCGWA